ncbi:hypothetical protein GCM10026982_61890 [Nocardiopsis aegyptia]
MDAVICELCGKGGARWVHNSTEAACLACPACEWQYFDYDWS